jgi:Cdc6-like AAA superfamily ATPase
MSLLESLRSETRTDGIRALGYTKNPFPPRGQVQDEVYVERAELGPLMASLTSFLKGENPARTWALAGESGVGKSNFLRHLCQELEEARSAGAIEGVAYRYMTSQQLTPRQLSESVAVAIGAAAFADCFRLLANGYQTSSDVHGTALGDFLAHMASSSATHEDAAKFAVRWLGGQQTYASERAIYGVQMRERLPPAIALPWLRHMMDLMESQGVLSRLILLLDEFEDVQSLSTAAQNDYLSTLKGLINAFNLERLFLILAGQPTAFDRMGQRVPSLKTRWEVVTLEPVRRSEDAVRLARRYQEHEHIVWLTENVAAKRKSEFRPNELEVRALFGDLLAVQPARGVTQRDLLAKLHEWVETHLAG